MVCVGPLRVRGLGLLTQFVMDHVPNEQFASIHDVARAAEEQAVEAALLQRSSRRRSTQLSGVAAPVESRAGFE